jgi:hypothetical protein
MISGRGHQGPVRWTIYSLATPDPIQGGSFSVSTPPAPAVRQSSVVPQRHRTRVEGEPETDGWAVRFHG